MAILHLSQGMEAIIDDCDLEAFGRNKWSAIFKGGHWYAVRKKRIGAGYRTTFLHREICGLNFGDRRIVDHWDRDGLNNRRANLRICTPSQNNANHAKFNGNSKFKGVHFSKCASAWRAEIKLEGKKRHLGLFTDEKSAAYAYDAAAIEIYGNYARTNGMMGLL